MMIDNIEKPQSNAYTKYKATNLDTPRKNIAKFLKRYYLLIIFAIAFILSISYLLNSKFGDKSQNKNSSQKEKNDSKTIINDAGDFNMDARFKKSDMDFGPRPGKEDLSSPDMPKKLMAKRENERRLLQHGNENVNESSEESDIRIIQENKINSESRQKNVAMRSDPNSPTTEKPARPSILLSTAASNNSLSDFNARSNHNSDSTSIISNNQNGANTRTVNPQSTQGQMGQMRQGQLGQLGQIDQITDTLEALQTKLSQNEEISQHQNTMRDSNSVNNKFSQTFKRVKNRYLTIPQGWYIPCVLETQLVSAIPGQAICILINNVYSEDGRFLLIEKGSRVVGNYSSLESSKEVRLGILWDTIRTPNGLRIQIQSPAADQVGVTGAPGVIDQRWVQRFSAAILVTFIRSSLAPRNSSLQGVSQLPQQSRSAGNQVQEAVADPTTQIIEQTLNLPPVLFKNRGDRLLIFMNRDLDFSPIYSARMVKHD